MHVIQPSVRVVADFEFYATFPDMIGEAVGVAPAQSAPDGYSALVCFATRDSTGERLPCREQPLLDKVWRGKQSANLQVKMWAEGVADATLPQAELITYCAGYPPWVVRAVLKQAEAVAMKAYGWAPRFARLVELNGHIVLPGEDHLLRLLPKLERIAEGGSSTATWAERLLHARAVREAIMCR